MSALFPPIFVPSANNRQLEDPSGEPFLRSSFPTAQHQKRERGERKWLGVRTLLGYHFLIDWGGFRRAWEIQSDQG